MQHRFVQYYPVLRRRRIIPGQNFLTAPDDLDPLLDYRPTEPGNAPLVYRTGKFRSLQKTWYNSRFVIADAARLGLQPDVSRIRQVVGLPPRLLAALPGQRGQMVTLSRVGHVVDRAQVADVPL